MGDIIFHTAMITVMKRLIISLLTLSKIMEAFITTYFLTTPYFWWMTKPGRTLYSFQTGTVPSHSHSFFGDKLLQLELVCKMKTCSMKSTSLPPQEQTSSKAWYVKRDTLSWVLKSFLSTRTTEISSDSTLHQVLRFEKYSYLRFISVCVYSFNIQKYRFYFTSCGWRTQV